MLLFQFGVLALLARHVSAILPEAQINRQDENNQLPSSQSLPNLLELKSPDDLAANWLLHADFKLEEGRLVVKKNAGSLWAKNVLENGRDEWTVEVTFRNSEQVSVDDHTYYDSNGFALWLLDGDSSMLSDFLNFGGPATYDGFQFLINNKEQKGLKIFANDGKQRVENSLSKALGECAINYLDLMVPFTLRVSYSGKTNWFKVQIDNNLCFKTDALTFANIKRSLRFGVSASTNEASKEYWEVFKFDVYPYLTENAIDDHGIISGGSIKQITVTEQAKPTSSPQIQRESLLEKSRKFREELQKQNTPEQPQLNFDFDSSFGAILEKLAVLEQSLDKVDTSKVPDLALALENVKSIQLQQLEVLGEMKNTYSNFELLLAAQYKEMSHSIEVLHERVIAEIKDHQSDLVNLGRKVDLIMANHKELRDQYTSANEQLASPDSSEFFSVILKWVLLPIVIGIALLATFVYRLRKDIKHSKLL